MFAMSPAEGIVSLELDDVAVRGEVFGGMVGGLREGERELFCTEVAVAGLWVGDDAVLALTVASRKGEFSEVGSGCVSREGSWSPETGDTTCSLDSGDEVGDFATVVLSLLMATGKRYLNKIRGNR